MMKPTFLLPAAIAALCLTFTACQTMTSKAPDRFAKADTNHDDKLSPDELNKYLIIAVFDSPDANHDGKMTIEEWAVEGDKGHEKAFRDRDANHDGVVTLDEALAYGRKKGIAAAMMKESDTNKDGYLSRE